ncbi:MAG: branched-chain-amino-acid transaminase [Thermoplasmata archaeon]
MVAKSVAAEFDNESSVPPVGDRGSSDVPAMPEIRGAVYIDGSFYPPSEGRISVFDHGLLYGDGVFEGIRFFRGRIFKLEQHVDRMFRSAAGINLVPPLSPSEASTVILETAGRSGLREGYLRPIITRGVGDVGLDPRSAKRPSFIVICMMIKPYAGKAETGIRLVVSSYRRTPALCLNPNIKSLNYLNNVLAKSEANARGADDAVLLDLDGYVTEATGENLFVVRQGVLYAPPTASNLEGVTRETIIELASGHVPFREERFALDFLEEADEVFLTGTAAGVLPVIAIEGKSVGEGRPGPITRELQRRYTERVESEGTPIPYDTTAIQ